MAAAVLIDSNILLRLLSREDPLHPAVETAIGRVLASGYRVVLVPQVVMESWVVLTRPREANGFGWSVADAARALSEVMRRLPLMPETPAVFGSWWEIVQGGVSGKRAHDARLAAAMKVNGLRYLMTFNVADFIGMKSILPFHPLDGLPVIGEDAADPLTESPPVP